MSTQHAPHVVKIALGKDAIERVAKELNVKNVSRIPHELAFVAVPEGNTAGVTLASAGHVPTVAFQR
jgi:pseudouridine-5'-phosphate glycosidase